MAEQGDGGHHPHERLTVEGEDGQEEDGIGMDMERVEAIVVKNDEEEAGEWGHQPRVDAVQEEGIECTIRGLRYGRGDLERGIPPLAIIARH